MVSLLLPQAFPSLTNIQFIVENADFPNRNRVFFFDRIGRKPTKENIFHKSLDICRVLGYNKTKLEHVRKTEGGNNG